MQGEVKKCPECGKLFVAHNYHHVFCSRRCFFSVYCKKKKNNFPTFVCQKCGVETKLDFHPRTSGLKWHNFRCPNCGDNHGENNRDYMIVREIRISFKKEALEKEIRRGEQKKREE